MLAFCSSKIWPLLKQVLARIMGDKPAHAEVRQGRELVSPGAAAACDEIRSAWSAPERSGCRDDLPPPAGAEAEAEAIRPQRPNPIQALRAGPTRRCRARLCGPWFSPCLHRSSFLSRGDFCPSPLCTSPARPMRPPCHACRMGRPFGRQVKSSAYDPAPKSRPQPTGGHHAKRHHSPHNKR